MRNKTRPGTSPPVPAGEEVTESRKEEDIVICIHHNDLDGRCAAAIVRGIYGVGAHFIETDYKNPPPAADDIRNMDVIIVDFSYKPEDMRKIMEMARSVTWIDHHATAKDYPYQDLPGKRDFKDKSKSGCELTWEYFHGETSCKPLAVRLIGDYDKWALTFNPDSTDFYEGMKLHQNDPVSPIWQMLFETRNGILARRIIEEGQTAILYRNAYCREMRDAFGFETEIAGFRAYATNIYKFGSGGFGEKFQEYPVVISYVHDGRQFTVSLYSSSVDVSAIAKANGGGGHKGAAGFVCKDLPFRRIQ
jgi:oligoribonuclease NrnB/cAMP/cGMP phosphodiesterase (DHH superfamily)